MSAGSSPTSARRPQYDPSDKGVPKNNSIPPTYMGCRTIAYGPVEITCWFGATSMIAEVNVFSR